MWIVPKWEHFLKNISLSKEEPFFLEWNMIEKTLRNMCFEWDRYEVDFYTTIFNKLSSYFNHTIRSWFSTSLRSRRLFNKTTILDFYQLNFKVSYDRGNYDYFDDNVFITLWLLRNKKTMQVEHFCFFFPKEPYYNSFEMETYYDGNEAWYESPIALYKGEICFLSMNEKNTLRLINQDNKIVDTLNIWNLRYYTTKNQFQLCWQNKFPNAFHHAFPIFKDSQMFVSPAYWIFQENKTDIVNEREKRKLFKNEILLYKKGENNFNLTFNTEELEKRTSNFHALYDMFNKISIGQKSYMIMQAHFPKRFFIEDKSQYKKTNPFFNAILKDSYYKPNQKWFIAIPKEYISPIINIYKNSRNKDIFNVALSGLKSLTQIRNTFAYCSYLNKVFDISKMWLKGIELILLDEIEDMKKQEENENNTLNVLNNRFRYNLITQLSKQALTFDMYDPIKKTAFFHLIEGKYFYSFKVNLENQEDIILFKKINYENSEDTPIFKPYQQGSSFIKPSFSWVMNWIQMSDRDSNKFLRAIKKVTDNYQSSLDKFYQKYTIDNPLWDTTHLLNIKNIPMFKSFFNKENMNKSYMLQIAFNNNEIKNIVEDVEHYPLRCKCFEKISTKSSLILVDKKWKQQWKELWSESLCLPELYGLRDINPIFFPFFIEWILVNAKYKAIVFTTHKSIFPAMNVNWKESFSKEVMKRKNPYLFFNITHKTKRKNINVKK